MLSLWPELLTYNFFGTALLRLTLGLVMLWLSTRHFRHRARAKTFLVLAVIELLIALALLIGLFTQAAALLLAALSLGSVVMNYHHRDDHRDGDNAHYLAFHLLLAGAALALTTLGAGAWAIDFPL